MFKVDENGVPFEAWPPIKLTLADLKTIAQDIAERTQLPTLMKIGGRWCQRSSMDVMEGGYRIYESQDEEDALAQLNADLDEELLMLSIREE